MSHEMMELYRDLATRPDRFQQISEFTRSMLVRWLIANGQQIPPELENRLQDQLQDEAWQKLEQ